MVLITETQREGPKVQENGVSAGVGPGKPEPRTPDAAVDAPLMSVTKVDEDGVECQVDFTRNYWEDEDDIYQEFEELDFDALTDSADSRSITSEDSFYPPSRSDVSRWRRSPSLDSPEPISFFKACCSNNTIIVRVMIRQGVSEEEVRETDRNRRSGLIVACYHGYVDVVVALARCPYLDVNWQDNEGNTALITAAQAGHVFISNYLLNYFPGLDLERRNCHGFTALMKAAMQGRADCVRSLVLAGANLQSRDRGRGLTPREWALFTGRHETALLLQRLALKPCAEQICDSFSLEWPMLQVHSAARRTHSLVALLHTDRCFLVQELVEQAQKPRSCWRRAISCLSCCPYRFYLSNRVAPVDDGVLDHAVRVTTSLRSPLVATACSTVSPGSPPCVGKRRYAVQEYLRRQRVAELRRLGPDRLNNYKRFFQNSRVLLVPRPKERRASLQPQLLGNMAAASSGAVRRASLLPLSMLRRSSVRPGLVVPKVRLCKAPAPSFVPEAARRPGDHHRLQIPKWDYKMKRVEKRYEEERQRLLPPRRR